MGYKQAIEATGVKVKEFEMFGSYQGDWIALLEDGRVITGSYGSCSGCDAFEAEFGYSDEPQERDGKYYKDYGDEISKEEYDRLLSEYNQKLCRFGQHYTVDAESLQDTINRYERKCADEYAWDDDKQILDWLKKKASEGVE
jgi:hypothetical protein